MNRIETMLKIADARAKALGLKDDTEFIHTTEIPFPKTRGGKHKFYFAYVDELERYVLRTKYSFGVDCYYYEYISKELYDRISHNGTVKYADEIEFLDTDKKIPMAADSPHLYAFSPEAVKFFAPFSYLNYLYCNKDGKFYLHILYEGCHDEIRHFAIDPGFILNSDADKILLDKVNKRGIIGCGYEIENINNIKNFGKWWHQYYDNYGCERFAEIKPKRC